MALSKELLYSGPVTDIFIDGSEHIYYTVDGVTLSFETEWIDIHTDQIPGVTKKKKISHKITISFKVPELEFAKLKYVFSQPDSNILEDVLTIDNQERPTHDVAILIPTQTGRVWKLEFDKCVCSGITEIAYKRGEQTAWQIQFEVLYDTVDDRYGYAGKT